MLFRLPEQTHANAAALALECIRGIRHSCFSLLFLPTLPELLPLFSLFKIQKKEFQRLLVLGSAETRRHAQPDWSMTSRHLPTTFNHSSS